MAYIEVTWVTEVPLAAGMSWGATVMLASGNAPGESNNPQQVTPNDYSNYLTSNSYEYMAYGSFRKNLVSTPSSATYVYWMGQGQGKTGILQKKTDISYYLPLGPFSSINKVEIDPTGGQNYQEILSTSISGYTAGTGYAGIYNGEINFNVDSINGGPYFESGGSSYKGVEGRAILNASGGILRTQALQNGFGTAAEELKDYDIQFVVPLYNVAGNGSGLEDTPAWNDLLNALTMVAGRRQMVIWALPKSASPNTDYHGISYDYNQFRNFVGQDKNASVIYADVAIGANLTGLDDPAAALAGRITAAHPHTPLTLDTITMSLASRANPMDKAAWDAGKIICVFRETDLGFTADQLNYGFTFAATSPSDRIENVRCKYIIEYNIKVDLWKLLSSKTVRINKAGLNRIIAIINGTLDRLLSQGIIDDGTRIVDIPLLRGSPVEWSEANLSRRVPSIIVRWPWKNSIESMIITQFGELI